MSTPFPLGALQQFDERSLNYPVTKLLQANQKQTLVSKKWAVRLELDQGPYPTCVGHGHAHNLATAPASNKKITSDTANRIYTLAQTMDGFSLPHDGSTVLAGAKAVQQLWPQAYPSYYWAFGLNEVLAALSHVGSVVFGVTWFSQMFYPNAKGVITASGSVAGRHCLEGVEIDVPNQMVRLKNSWGKAWGVDNGCCWISWHSLDKLLKDGGEAMVTPNRKLVTIT